MAKNKVKKNNRTKTWPIIVGIIVGIIVISGIVIGLLAANGVFDDYSCPSGEHRVCGRLGNGEEACTVALGILRPIPMAI